MPLNIAYKNLRVGPTQVKWEMTQMTEKPLGRDVDEVVCQRLRISGSQIVI